MPPRFAIYPLEKGYRMESEPQSLASNWLEPLISQTQDLAFISVRADGVIEDWLGAAERMFGWTRHEAVGRPYRLIFTLQDVEIGMDSAELEVASVRGRSEDDRWHLRKDSSVFWGSGVTQALRDDSGALKGYCKFVRDRTDLRTNIKALENRAMAAEVATDRQRKQLATIAHEIAQPLNAACITQELAVRATDAAERELALQRVVRQLGVLKRLVSDLSDLARAQVGTPLLHITRFELQSILFAGLAPFQASAAASVQRLELIMPSTPLHIEADEQRFLQMVTNLVGNALKYTPGGSVVVSLSIEGSSAVVRVDDDGVGIDPDALQPVFELFTRERRDVDAPEGLGVGLAVVKELAQAHGGVVEARSPGKGFGSTFSLRLPLRSELNLNDLQAVGQAMSSDSPD